MPIASFSFNGAAGSPLSEMDRPNKLLSAADPSSKLSAISKMAEFRGAIAGIDLSAFRGVLSDHARFANVHSEHFRLAVALQEMLRFAKRLT